MGVREGRGICESKVESLLADNWTRASYELRLRVDREGRVGVETSGGENVELTGAENGGGVLINSMSSLLVVLRWDGRGKAEGMAEGLGARIEERDGGRGEGAT